MAQYARKRKKRERRSGKLINLDLYSDGWCSMSLYKIGKRDNTNSRHCVEYIPDTLNKIIPPFFWRRWWVFPFSFGPDNFPWHPGSSIAHDYMWKHSETWLIRGWCLQCFYLLYVNPLSCCSQRQASCSNLLTALVKFLSKRLALIETCSQRLRQLLKHFYYAVILPPAGPFGENPCCSGIATRWQYW